MFNRSPKHDTLPAAPSDRDVDLVLRVESGDDVVSPLTGFRGALVAVTLLERLFVNEADLERIEVRSGRAAPWAYALRQAVSALMNSRRFRYRDDELPRERWLPLGSALFGEGVVLVDAAGRAVRVPAAGLVASPWGEPLVGTPLEREPPPELAGAFASATNNGVVCFHEWVVRRGERVRLRAALAEGPSPLDGGYRGRLATGLVARAGRAAPELEELAPRLDD
jgi:hypothetical protein